MAKNVTIRLSEETAHWARVKAAEENTSVSRLVGLMLEKQMKMSDQYHQAHQHWLKTMSQFKEQGAGMDSSQRWSREEAHDRRR